MSSFRNLTKKQKTLLHEALERLNQRRLKRKLPGTIIERLPDCPGNVANFYLVDNYNVKRHWRRRPVRK